MKTVVVVVVYDRFENLKLWLNCWDQCDKTDSELVVIHNNDNAISEIRNYLSLCNDHGVTYIPRANIGYDIGAFKDVCEGKIKLDFDRLIWATDDTIPMSKSFVQEFNKHIKGDVGLSCVEMSKLRSPLHVRTTGFCINKQVATDLKFNKVVTKEDCYQFEHRGGDYTLMKQVEAMGLKCIQIDKPEKGPLWDTGNRLRFQRWDEHHKVFKPKAPGNKVLFICPVYNSFPEIVSSLICQTHKNWELILIHDGPNSTGLRDYIESVNDPRIIYSESENHVGLWGHSYRAAELAKLKDSDADYVVITNADNHHVPVYCEYMIKGITDNDVASYCSDMVHSYKAWQVISCSMRRGFVDSAGVMVRASVAHEIGWRDTTSHSSDWFYFQDIINKYGSQRFAKVKGCLLIHN